MAWVCSAKIENRKINDVNVTPMFDSRFKDDKVYIEAGHRRTLVDGVILNKSELEEEKAKGFRKIVLEQGCDCSFPRLLRGPFTGMFYDGEQLCAYGNQTGDTCVFYYIGDETILISPDFNLVVKACRQAHKKLTFDTIYANHILSFGYAVEGHTVLNEIHKTQPGSAVVYSDGNVLEKRYHEFVPKRHEIKIDDAIEELDIRFREAVKRCFEKDLEYGYSKHLADMSGGLDSRMTTWVAYTMGYTPITNMSYAKKGSQDEVDSRLVAEHLGNEYLFDPLDGVEFIYDLEEIVKMNFGLATYVGITGGKQMLSRIDFKTYGLEHTGQIGDVVIGSFCRKVSDNSSIETRSIQYSDHVRPIIAERNKYETREVFELYYRAFQGALMTHQIRRNYTEVVSPFLDVDFIQFCLDLPLEYRCKHKLYFKWVETKYPDALRIPCTRERPGFHKLTRKDIYHIMPTWARHVAIAVSKKLHLSALISDKTGMNPMDYWYENNLKMREYINAYYEQHIGELASYIDTTRDLEKMFQNGRTMDKLLVLTVIAAFHIYLFEE